MGFNKMTERIQPADKKKCKDGKPFGRPLEYDKNIADEICRLTETTRHGYRRLAQDNPHFPCFEAFSRWRKQVPDFHDRYLEAKGRQAAYCMESLSEEAEEALLYYHTKDGERKIDGASVAWAKLVSENRKYMAAKLAPKLYGDARDLEIERGRNAALQAELDALRAKLDKANTSEF